MRTTFAFLIVFFQSVALIAGDEKTATQKFFDLDDALRDVISPYVLAPEMGLILTDHEGDTSMICLDVSIDRIGIEQEFDELTPEQLLKIEKDRERCVFVGALNAYDSEAEKIEFRSDLEKLILERLRIMIERNPRFKEDLSRFVKACTDSDRLIPVEYGYKVPNK